MTQYPNQPTYLSTPTNGLAVAGLICSILGWFTGGLLCPVGLILSLVALGRPYGRGTAIAGLIIGLLGTCGGILLVIAVVGFGLAVVLAMAGIFMFTQHEKLELTADMAQIANAAEQYKQQNQHIAPPGLESLRLDESTLIDPWGHRYRYVLITEDPGFDIISDGKDGKPETPDDIHLNKLDKYWEHAMDDFKAKLEEMDQQHHRRRGVTSSSTSQPDDATAPMSQPE